MKKTVFFALYIVFAFSNIYATYNSRFEWKSEEGIQEVFNFFVVNKYLNADSTIQREALNGTFVNSENNSEYIPSVTDRINRLQSDAFFINAEWLVKDNRDGCLVKNTFILTEKNEIFMLVKCKKTSPTTFSWQFFWEQRNQPTANQINLEAKLTTVDAFSTLFNLLNFLLETNYFYHFNYENCTQ